MAKTSSRKSLWDSISLEADRLIRLARQLTSRRRQDYRELTQSRFLEESARLSRRVSKATSESQIRAFEDGLGRLVRDHIVSQAALGLGRAPRRDEIPQIRAGIERQMRFIQGFGDSLRQSLRAGVPISFEKIQSRASLYAGAGRAQFFFSQEGLLPEGTLIDYVARDDDHLCSACLSAEREGPYQPGKGPMPGDACFGRGRCRCQRIPRGRGDQPTRIPRSKPMPTGPHDGLKLEKFGATHNPTYLTTINGEKFLVKGAHPRAIEREIRVSRFGRAIGLGDWMSETSRITIDGKEYLAVRWVSGMSDLMSLSRDDRIRQLQSVDQARLTKAAMLDYLLRNTDRSADNVLFHRDRLLLIDHEFCFDEDAKYREFERPNALDIVSSGHGVWLRSAIRDMIDDADDFGDEFEGVFRFNRDHYNDRLEILRQAANLDSEEITWDDFNGLIFG